MKELQKKIEQWFIDQDVPEHSRSVESEYIGSNTFMNALWSVSDHSHMLSIKMNGIREVHLYMKGDWCELKNQTEANVFQLLSCLVNHIK